jgi:Flp pilus assembly protein TadG
MAIDKRAQIFTLISIVLLSLVFLSFEIYTFIQEKNSVQTRVDTMNSFLRSIETNLERQLYIVGFRIIFLAETQITTSGAYIDVDSFFDDAFFNGIVDGDTNNTLLIGVTYDDLIESLNDKASKINVNITLSNTVINISQTDPWHVRFDMVSDFVMVDNQGLANWSKQQIYTAFIPVSGFEDPLYTINSNALVSRKINQTPFEGNYTDGADVTNIFSHVANGYYSANSNAPSFLNRLEGNLSADLNGIESFVDVAEFSTQGITTKTKTLIDYIYFSSDDPTDYSVPGMQAWFLIDDETDHLEKYNVSGIAV